MDDHGHDHDHDHGPQGLRGVLAGIFSPHSHDAGDSIDSALESSHAGIRALKISLLGLAVTALFQVAIVAISGSVALLADTIHNFSDALTAIPLGFAFWLGRRRPTPRYTYGYGRAEDLAGIFIVAMIALSAAVAGWEAVQRLLDPQDIDNVGWVIAAGVIGFAGNELVALYRIRVGRRIGSAALVADGLHARTDGFTSLAVVGGAVGVLLGIPLADPIVGLFITVAILFVLRNAGRDIYRRLMDSVDPELVDQVRSMPPVSTASIWSSRSASGGSATSCGPRSRSSRPRRCRWPTPTPSPRRCTTASSTTSAGSRGRRSTPVHRGMAGTTIRTRRTTSPDPGDRPARLAPGAPVDADDPRWDIRAWRP